MSPGFTPTMLLRISVTVPIVNLTLFLQRDFKMLIIFGGKPNLSGTIHSISRGTLPNALIMSIIPIQVLLQCS